MSPALACPSWRVSWLAMLVGSIVMLAACASSGSNDSTQRAVEEPTEVSPEPTLRTVVVYDPDEEDDAPVSRHIFVDECPSGIALQDQAIAMIDADEAGRATEWEAVQFAFGADAVESQSSRLESSRQIGQPETSKWLVRSSDALLGVVELRYSGDEMWIGFPPAECVDGVTAAE